MTGQVVIGAFGACQPTLSGDTQVDIVNGIANFTTIMLSTISCLGTDVGIQTAIANDGGGIAPARSTDRENGPLSHKHGAPHRVTFATENNVQDRTVTMSRSDGHSCMQIFELGQASVGAVVRDAQNSPVPDYALPVDLRLCDAPIVPGDEPSCPAASSMLLGTVQAMPVDGYVLFNNFTVTNISNAFVLQLYTPLLADYSDPFAACDKGVPQSLEFVQFTDEPVIAGVPFNIQPFLIVNDGFGNRIQNARSIVVNLQAVRSSYEPDQLQYLNAEDDASTIAQLAGASSVESTMSDPLGLDAWNTSVYRTTRCLY